MAWVGVILFFSVSFSYAQFGVLPSAGVTPDSSLFFFERLMENIQTLFTFGNAARAKRSVRLSEERLAEAVVLAHKNSKKFEEALTLFRKEFERARLRSEETKVPDVRVIINESINKHFIIFEEMRDIVPEQKRSVVEDAIAVSKQAQFSTLKSILEVDADRAIALGMDAAKERLFNAKREAENGRIFEFEENITHAKLLFDVVAKIPDEQSDALRNAANETLRIIDLLDEIYDKKASLPDQKKVIDRITNFKNHAIEIHILLLTQLVRRDPKSVVSILLFSTSGRLSKMERIADGDSGELAFIFPDYESYLHFSKEVMKRAGRYRVHLQEETVADTLGKNFSRELLRLQKLKGTLIAYRESFDRIIATVKEIQIIEPEPFAENQLPSIPKPEITISDDKEDNNGKDGEKEEPPPPSQFPEVRISAVPIQIKKGEKAKITWEAVRADSCIASEGWSGTKSVSGAEQVSPSQTTTYVITCSNNAGRATNLVIVTVISPTMPTVNISANPSILDIGQSAVLTWTSSNANTCVASDGWSGAKSVSGSQTVSPSITRTYVLTCSNANGSSSSQTTVTVRAVLPTVTLSAHPLSIKTGESSVLTWSSSNANTCTASNGWSGSKSLSGSLSISPTATKTYTLTCSNDNGNASANVVITVTANGTPPPPPPPPPTF